MSSSATAFNRILKTVPVSAFNQNMSLFQHVEKLPPDAIFHVKTSYGLDQAPDKVNLGIGAYRDNDGKPIVLEIVKAVEQEILNDENEGKINKEYLPIAGDKAFTQLSQRLLLGLENLHAPLAEKDEWETRIAGVQTLSGTGALRVVGEFIKSAYPDATVYLSSPTWGNHKKVLKKCFLNQAAYRYFKPETRGLDIDGMLEDLNNAPDGSVIMMHACAHNPTGVDPNQEQWQQIAEVIQRKRMITWFDCAYQGYATGELANDAFAVRFFKDQGMEMVISQSFAKNMGLYGERTGAASVLCATPEAAGACQTQLNAIIRPMYSNPPKHGMLIAKRILQNPEYFNRWLEELRGMSGRIVEMRAALRGSLERNGAPGTWNHITDQIGMFSFTGLTAAQVERMKNEHHVYMLSNGRISMAGINTGNVEKVAQAMAEVIKAVPQ